MRSDPLGEYDVGEPITLSCLFLTGQTVAEMTLNQTTVYVRDLSGLTLTPGAPIVVVGAAYVNGDLHSTVVSNDGVGAIVIAHAARVSVVRTLVGTPTDPTTVVCKVMKPDGTEGLPTASSTVTGLWKATFTAAADGDFYYRFTGSGAAAGDAWRKFVVRPERAP
jgi:hypothetical protein